MNAVERCLAHAEDQASALLEADIGSALYQVRGHTVGNAGQCAHGAGQHNHSIGRAASAGDVGPDVGLGMLHNLAL